MSSGTEPSSPPAEVRREYRRKRRSGGGSGGGERRGGPASGAPADPEDGAALLDNTTLGLLAGVALLLVAEAPRLGGTLQALCVIGGTAVLVLTLALCRTFAEDLRPALLRGPNPFIVLLGLWSAASFFLSPFRAQAAADLMRVVAGIAAYLIGAYALPQGRQLGRAIAGLLLFGVGLAGYDLSQVAKVQGVRGHLDLNNYSAFGTHENVGSLLVLLIPPALAFAVSSQTDEKPRYAAQFAVFLLGFALLVARTRSAWIGAVVALLCLAALLAAYGRVAVRGREGRDEGDADPRRSGPGRKGSFLSNLVGSPALMVVAGFAVLVAAGGIVPQLAKRTGSLGSINSLLEDGSFGARLHQWESAARMARERPVTGWGLGSYVVTQGRWSHAGKDAAEVLSKGAGHENIAHDYYVQWAADAGGVGLLLYGAAVTAFVLTVVIAHARGGVGGPSPTPLRRALALGAAAAVVGAAVDAVASPAYNFHGVSTVLWAWMGLGIGALRADPARRRTGAEGETPTTTGRPALPGATPWQVWAGGLLAGTLLTGVVLGWGEAQLRRGRVVPRGAFRVDIDTPYVVPPGTGVTFKATFKDEKGIERATMPGTTWEVRGEQGLSDGNRVTLLRMDGRVHDANDILWDKAHAGLRILTPSVFSPITVIGHYTDEYGRPYRFASSVLVRPDAPPPPAPKGNGKKPAGNAPATRTPRRRSA